MIHLVLGGARSGKSAYAEREAQDSGNNVVYIATAQALDEEMSERIAHHQARRPASWQLVESELYLAAALRANAAAQSCVIVDCLTLWLSNVLLLEDEAFFVSERDALLRVLSDLPGKIILVANEVGLGVVPMGNLSRRFVDEAGRLNQELAQMCERVTFVVAGLPQQLK